MTEKNSNIYMIAIVAIVAVVGIVVMLHANRNGEQGNAEFASLPVSTYGVEQENIAGDAITRCQRILVGYEGQAVLNYSYTLNATNCTATPSGDSPYQGSVISFFLPEVGQWRTHYDYYGHGTLGFGLNEHVCSSGSTVTGKLYSCTAGATNETLYNVSFPSLEGYNTFYDDFVVSACKRTPIYRTICNAQKVRKVN